MGPYMGGFQAWLLERGYTPGTVRQVLKLARQLGRWMVAAQLEPSQLDESTIGPFLRSRGTTPVPGARRLKPLLEYLRNEGVLKPEIPPPTPVGVLVARYRTWLVDERGLAAETVLRYERTARRFLQRREAAVGSLLVEDLTSRDVVSFLLEESARVSVGAAKGRVAELRSLLRFLYLQKLTAVPLAAAVPPVAGLA